MDLDELPESGRVVVPHRLGVAEGLQDRVGVQDLLFKRSWNRGLNETLDLVRRFKNDV